MIEVKKMLEDEKYREQCFDILHEMSVKEYRDILENPAYEGIPFAKSFFHVHTDMGSPMDAVLTVKQYYEKAALYGCRTMTVTDHGSMYGVVPLDNLITEKNKHRPEERKIYLGIGCELYVANSIEKHCARRHLCIYVKDAAGYEALCHLITQSQYRLMVAGGLQYPCVSEEMLEKYIGPGSSGHGHVILTSACIGGVVSAVAAENIRNTEDLKNKRSEYTRLSSLLDAMESSIKENGKVASDIQKQVNAVMKTYTDRDMFAAHISRLKANISNLEGIVFEPKDTEMVMEKEVLKYDRLAGHGNWYAELQYHGIPEEKRLMPILAKVAQQHRIPLIAANDAHMDTADDCELRKYLNAMRFGSKWKEAATGDEQLYLKTDRELYQSLCKIVDPDTAFESMLGRDHVARQMQFKLKKETHYPKYYE